MYSLARCDYSFVFSISTEKMRGMGTREYDREKPVNSPLLTHLCPPLRLTFAVRETASLGIMGAPRVPPLSPPETIVLSEHYRL